MAGVPSAMFRLGSISPSRLKKMEKEGYIPPLHSSKYAPDVEEAVQTGIKAFVAAVQELTKSTPPPLCNVPCALAFLFLPPGN